MKKILITLVFLLVSVFLFSSPLLIDNANLLSENEKAELTKKLEEVKEKTTLTVVIVTDTSSYGKGDMEAADYIFENGDYGDDGVVFFLNMGDRSYYISTSGYAMYALDDYALSDDKIYSPVISYLSKGEYYTAFTNFASYVEIATLDSTRESYENHTLNSNGDWVEVGVKVKRFDWAMALLFSLIVGVTVSIIVVSKERRKMKNVALVNNADDYVVPNSFNLDENENILLYSHVSRVMKAPPRDDNNFGGNRPHHTTTHISSGGGTHGGRGGKF